MNCKQITLLPLVLLFISHLSAQHPSYDWWNEKHNWDGQTNWYNYLILSPKYMGPNAIPIPEVGTGELLDAITSDKRLDFHFMPGERSQTLWTALYFPFKDRIAFEMHGGNFEHFATDTIVRDERRARDRDSKGWALLDLNLSTHIQLIKDHDFLPDVVFRYNVRTAPGTNAHNARTTDSPGYFTDVSLGRTIPFEDGKSYARVYGMIGFYVWQLNRDDYRQNDAMMYGGGFNLKMDKLFMSHQLSGYSGYIHNGDQALVYRLTVEYQNKNFYPYIRYSNGLLDFPYKTFTIGAKTIFRPKTKSQ